VNLISKEMLCLRDIIENINLLINQKLALGMRRVVNNNSKTAPRIILVVRITLEEAKRRELPKPRYHNNTIQ
jgi:hypothetical protein